MRKRDERSGAREAMAVRANVSNASMVALGVEYPRGQFPIRIAYRSTSSSKHEAKSLPDFRFVIGKHTNWHRFFGGIISLEHRPSVFMRIE